MDKKLKKKISELMPLIKETLSLSKDSTKVAAIALDKRLRVILSEYNRFPDGVVEHEVRFSEENKLLWTGHAEENLVARACYEGKSLRGSTVIVIGKHPCNVCARMLSKSGVSRLITFSPKEESSWYDYNLIAKAIFEESKVEVFYID